MMKNKIIIAPSILSANFIDLNAQLESCWAAGIRILHYDVMDFDFVPNLTFGSKILKDIVRHFNFQIDIHLMVKVKTRPFAMFFKEFIACRPTIMTMHVEAMTHQEITTFIHLCQDHSIGASLAISPRTSIKKIEPYLQDLQNVLIMSVEPGFGGQPFIKKSLEKVSLLKEIRTKHHFNYTIEIDGGINQTTAPWAIEAGADILVAGSYIFDSSNIKESVEVLNA